MTEDELINVLRNHRKDALGPNNKTLTTERAEAMDRYHGRPYGDEEAGCSQVVTHDLAETVDWVMPAFMRSILQSGNPVEFTPVGQDDEERASQETDYTNHVIMKDNDGFMLIHDTVKDALLLKNCYAKHYRHEEEKVNERDYAGLSIEELTIIYTKLQQAGDEFELVRPTENDDGTIDVTVKTTKMIKKIIVEAVPPEELNISSRSRGSLQDSDFVEHMPPMTRSDLIKMGMPKKWVADLPAKGLDKGFQASDDTTEQRARNSIQDEDTDLNYVSIDKSMEIVDYKESYVRTDYDDDGVAELRKVVTVDNRIPPGKEWNIMVDAIPFTGGSTKRVPHRHIGESVNDDIEDLARIHTTLMRQGLDNIYRTNNMEWLINDRAHMPDFMETQPGGFKRLTGDGPVVGNVEAVQVQPIFNMILPAIDTIKQTREQRTGISSATTGISPDQLRDTNNGAFYENLNQASQKVEMLIRMYLETFLKPLALQVHRLILEDQSKERIVKLRGSYVPVNPMEWEERTDMTVKVGLGTGSGQEKMQKLTMLGNALL